MAYSSKDVFGEALKVIEESMVFLKENRKPLPKSKIERLGDVMIHLINFPDPETDPTEEEMKEIMEFQDLIDVVWNLNDEIALMEQVRIKEEEYKKARDDLDRYRYQSRSNNPLMWIKPVEPQ